MAASTIQIRDVHPSFDGDYPIDLSTFTNRDFHDIKRIANVRSQELSDAFAQGDTDLFVAFAVIALRRAGKPVVEEALWEAEVGRITFVAADEEAEARPPSSPSSSGSESSSGDGGSSSDEKPTSGSSSASVSVLPASDPSRTGSQPSGTGAMSA